MTRRWTSCVLLVVVALIAAVGVWFGHRSIESGRQHGNPDPGGSRLAALRAIAPQMVPSAVIGLRTEVHRFRWDPQTCDGDAPGWAVASVDMMFRGSSTVPASLDALMGRLGWKQYKPAAPSSGPMPASPGPGFRVYEPAGANPYSQFASLTPPGTFGGGLWDLDVTSDPAEVPSHDC